ncbi:MAG: hypothetical protein L0228_14365 [Planctomycetes bacterium]|nr:hypothetical protein [Planctomycetota bacterium]
MTHQDTTNFAKNSWSVLQRRRAFDAWAERVYYIYHRNYPTPSADVRDPTGQTV